MSVIGLDLRMSGIENGGIGRYAFELAKNLLEQDKLNRYILFYNTPNQAKEIKDNFKGRNYELIYVKAKHYSFLEQTEFLYKLNKSKIDLMHFPNFNFPILYKRPFIVTIHDVIHHSYGGVKKANLVKFFAYKKVIQSAVFNSKGIISVSKESKKQIQKTFFVNPEKIKVIYEAPTNFQKPSEYEIKSFLHNLQLNNPYFIFVGVLQRNKNLVNLCKGFKKFKQNTKSNFELLIVGKPDMHYPDIKTECLNVLDKGEVVFAGLLGNAELSIAYRQARAFVSASLDEGFGLPGLEAMSLGLPLGVSNLSVFNEIYENGAIYFDPNSPDSISECFRLLAEDEKYFLMLKEKAYNRSLEFSWKKCANETLSFYNKFL